MAMVGRTLGLRYVGSGLAVSLVLATAGQAQQQPDLGPRPVIVADTPYTFDTAEQHGIKVSVVARGLAHPFSLAFLPNGDALVSIRSGGLRLVRNAASSKGGAATLVPQPIGGTPEAYTQRTSGLHDLALHPKFAENSLVYFSYNKLGEVIADSNPPGRRQSAITVQRGKLAGLALTDVQELFTGEWSTGSSGSRLAFGNDGLLYVSTGAPFGMTTAQDPSSVYGKILRLRDDGKPAPDNPFAKQAGARAEVFSMGHRDQLGLTVHPSGAVLAAEHGPNGGDEINLILPGRNYGWPTYTYGRNYDGTRLSAMPVVDGIEQPLVVYRADGHHGLHGRQVCRLERQPIRRQRADRRDSAHGRSRARRAQRQARRDPPRAVARRIASAHSRCAAGAGRLALRDHGRGRRRAAAHRADDVVRYRPRRVTELK
jgi:glucose/arabinose dehydrogenase